MPPRKPNSRSVTFRMPSELYERVEALAYADLQAAFGLDASVDDLNISEFLRDLVAQIVQHGEDNAPGGREALIQRLREAQASALQTRLHALNAGS